MKKNNVKTLSFMAMFSALCFVGTFIHIPINVGSSTTMIHLGNIFLLVGSLYLGGIKGGLSAAVGMTIFDLTNGYATYAPSTFILKFLMAFVCGSVYTNLKDKNMNKNLVLLIALTCGGLTNIILDPIVTAYMRKWIFGLNQGGTNLIILYESFATVINAVIAISFSFVIYKTLEKANLTNKFVNTKIKETKTV